jgi:hypothetical protein
LFGLYTLFFPWGQILQVLALVHFAKRRPDGYWLWIIFMGGGLGAAAYFLVEVLPDFTLLRGELKFFSRRKRIQELEAMVEVNASPGNYEELADLLLENKQYARAKECFDKAISSRTDSSDPFYRRALCLIAMNDFAAAAPDLEATLAKDRKYDFNRAGALLAHCYAKTGKVELAEKLFADVSQTSTLSETQYNYACFLLSQGRAAEARELANRILMKKPTLPTYLKRRERPWFRKAKALMKYASATGATKA